MQTGDDRGVPDMVDAFELAALVYDDGVAVDHLMCFFADELRAAGRRIGGIVQLPPDEDTEPGQIRVLDLMTGDVFPIKQKLGPGATSCTLDSAALADASARIGRAVDARVDLVMISKFSKQEMAGHGLRSEFGAAVAAGLPVLTSIKRPAVEPWLRFTGGIGTLLACRLRVLRDWWAETDGRRAAIYLQEARRAAAAAADARRPVKVG
ncbi:DUF2478 domain-containing protein [Methyloraptor flagellatus]|uniref:DUF2478 domain-containing protein n=1 Tax=Methyloraptor flagellatus TaxID=3162530 RepID=A0AAU7XFH0_9HYPH